MRGQRSRRWMSVGSLEPARLLQTDWHWELNVLGSHTGSQSPSHRYTDSGTTNPSTGPMTPDVWQGSHESTRFGVTDMTWPGTSGSDTRSAAQELFVGWLLNVPATGLCISGTDLLRQLYVLPLLRQKLQIELSISPSHSILTPSRPVPALTLERQTPGRVATGVSMFKSLVWLDPEKIPSPAGFEPGIFRSRGRRTGSERFTTEPLRR